MMNFICAIIMAVTLMTSGDIYATIQEAVDAVSETTPAKSWDGQYLKSIQLIERENVVEFNIQNVGGRVPKESETSKDDIIKGGIWYIACFMTGYDYSVNEGGCEGDSEMYKRVGPLLKLMAENTIGARFILDFRKGGSFSLDLSPKDVAKAVKLRKDTFYEEYSK